MNRLIYMDNAATTPVYPEVYDEKYKRWSLETLPFLPEEFKYEVIPQVKKQYKRN